MTTKKQLIANRENARKSTGPRTTVGKAISSRNAETHRFYSTTVLLPDEDHEGYLRFARRLVNAYSPNGVLEEEAVRTIIEVRWQMRRANLVDSELFQMYRNDKGEKRGVGTAFAHDATQANAFSKLTRYQAFLLRKLQIAEKDLARLKASTPQTPDNPALDVIGGPVLPKQLPTTANPPGYVAADIFPRFETGTESASK